MHTDSKLENKKGRHDVIPYVTCYENGIDSNWKEGGTISYRHIHALNQEALQPAQLTTSWVQSTLQMSRIHSCARVELLGANHLIRAPGVQVST